MKHIPNTILTLLFFCSILSNSSAQKDQILVSQSGMYFHNEKLYEADELELLIIKNPNAYYLYKSGIDKKNSAHRYLVVGGSTLGLSIGSLIIANSTINSNSDNLAEVFVNITGGAVFGTLGAIGLLTGTLITAVGINKKVGSSRRIKKAINIYNQGILEELEHKETSSLHIQGTSNGVGLVFSF